MGVLEPLVLAHLICIARVIQNGQSLCKGTSGIPHTEQVYAQIHVESGPLQGDCPPYFVLTRFRIDVRGRGGNLVSGHFLFLL